MAKHSFLLFLGRESDLAFSEVKAFATVNNLKSPVIISKHIALVSSDDNNFAHNAQSTLGGCIKVAKVVDKVAQPTEETVLKKVQEAVSASIRGKEGKVTFSITVMDPTETFSRKILNEGVKQWLASQGVSTRFVAGAENGLTSVQLDTQRVLKKGFELSVVYGTDVVYLAQTMAFQDYKDWSQRDYGRPRSNPYRGMLPPKVARMMVNIARGRWQGAEESENLTMLDPFCGEGTILQEALALNMDVIGSDIDPKAINDTKENVGWFLKTYGMQAKTNIFVSGVSQVSQKLYNQSVDLIITEPYLGKPAKNALSQKEAESITKSVGHLFTELLITTSRIQKVGGIIAVVIPKMGSSRFSRVLLRQSEVDSCEKFGYTLSEGPLPYARPDAKIGRAIYILRKVRS